MFYIADEGKHDFEDQPTNVINRHGLNCAILWNPDMPDIILYDHGRI